MRPCAAAGDNHQLEKILDAVVRIGSTLGYNR